MIMATESSTATAPSSGGRLVTSDGRHLPLRGVHLAAEAGGGIARVTLTQRFANDSDDALQVRYLLGLPSDGAVSGFSFTLGDTRVTGEVTGKQQARERFERALVQGKTAALLEQDRTSLFTQRVGNIPPRTEVVAEVVVDQPLRWLEEGCWEWRFPTVVGPRYQGQPGRVADAGKLSVPVADGPLPAGATLALNLADALTGPVESPSHPVQTRGSSPVQVRLEGDGAARLDRDVVVRWPVALPDVSATVIAARPDTAAHDGDTFALLTVAPPTGGWTAVPRDLTVLVDTSGSMGGRPLDQAKRVILALLETLGVRDRIELIEFGNEPRRWKAEPTLATESSKAEARRWVESLRATGCTEMHRAVLEALRPLRENSQRQVLLVTDGYIGFEQEIVRTLLNDLPAGARLHTVGVGSSVNRSLTEAAARAGRGTELIVGLNEDPDRLVGRLLARTTAPLVTDLVVEGAGVQQVAPTQLPDLYAEAPALVAVRVSGGGEVVLRGCTADGAFEQRLRVPPLQPGEGPAGVAALYGRERVRDLETRLSAGGDVRELNPSIEATGVAFQIATRLTSWIAVSETVTVQPEVQKREVEQPHQLPHGVSAAGLGLRKPGPYVSAAEAARRLQVDGDELLQVLAEGRLRGFRKDSELRFKADDIERLKRGEGEPTVILTDSDSPLGVAEEGGELILEDSTSDTVVHVGDLEDGKIIFDTSEEYTVDPRESEVSDPESVIPTVEVPSIAKDMGLVETDDDAALVEVGSDKDMKTEAFELMDDGVVRKILPVDPEPEPEVQDMDYIMRTSLSEDYAPRSSGLRWGWVLGLGLAAVLAIVIALVLLGVIPWS